MQKSTLHLMEGYIRSGSAMIARGLASHVSEYSNKVMRKVRRSGMQTTLCSLSLSSYCMIKKIKKNPYLSFRDRKSI